MAGDVSSSLVRVPFEVVKQRMQVGVAASTADAVKMIWRNEGLRGYWTGLTSTILREMPFDAIEFLLYERGKSYLLARQPKPSDGSPSQLPPIQGAAIGSLAGGVAAAVTTPLDVIKTRIMTQQRGVQHSAPLYTGVGDAFRRIWREEGPAALYRGIAPRVAWISLGGAIFFGVYEQATSLINERHRQQPPAP
eukprot:TRINITY_DN3325_c0_g1_i4.p2 TRINITY_DN3325_c0_g1~~TRINITY_DN3325_c0_g1_i4.p2  ORF type:complete len:193 (-),score=36.10 TRINITY_DN3325_c0_g1_i4:8-586(-)